MKEKLYSVVGKVLGVSPDSLDEDSSQDTVEFWDSFKHINMIIDIEEEFKVMFSDDEISNLYAIKDILEVLARKEQLS